MHTAKLMMKRIMAVLLSLVPGILVSMKTSGWVGAGAVAVVLVGGGIFGVQALTADPGGETHTVDDFAPSDATETPEATATPTVEATPEVTETPSPTPTPTPTPEVVETPEPVDEPAPVEEAPSEPVAPEPLTEDQIFLNWANPLLASYGGEMSDADMLAALDRACYLVANEIDERAIPVELDNEYNDINMVFMGAARNGYFTEGNVPASFCD